MHLRRFPAALFLIAAPLLAGCFQSSTLVKLNPDGSGTIELTTTMTTKTLARLAPLAASVGEEDQVTPETLFSADAAREAVDEMGSSVTFVSARRIDTRDRKGIKVVYAFKDIRTLRLSTVNPPPGADFDAGEDMLMNLSFTRLPNGHSLLTIKDGIGAPDPPPADAARLDEPQVRDEMDAMFAGLKLDIAIQVGHLVKTNIPCVKGDTVTLLSADFDQVLATPGSLEKVQKSGTRAGGSTVLQSIDGIKACLGPEATIEFGK